MSLDHPGHAWIIDDDASMRASLTDLLDAAGWQTDCFPSARDALKRLDPAQGPDVVLSDVRMPGPDGLDLLDAITAKDGPPVILISAHGDIPTAVRAMQAGAYTFLEKPYDPRRLLTALSHAAEQHRLRQQAARLKDRLATLSGLDRVVIGRTPAIGMIREQMVDIADAAMAILIQGETGTGKELVARALHDLSPRAARPYLALNAANLPAESFEATLFGSANQPGLLSGIDGGTLFLDEVAACPPEVQAKLLRLIETGDYLVEGKALPQHADLRLVSASNEDLAQAVAEDRLRADLYHRLAGVTLTLPTLRARADDIPLLFAHFASRLAEVYETRAPDLTAEDTAALMAHDWPGNVRELRHAAERFVLASRRGTPVVADILSPGAEAAEMPATLREAVAAFERQLIARALVDHGGRMDTVAAALGIGRRTLNEKIVKLGLNKDELG